MVPTALRMSFTELRDSKHRVTLQGGLGDRNALQSGTGGRDTLQGGLGDRDTLQGGADTRDALQGEAGDRIALQCGLGDREVNQCGAGRTETKSLERLVLASMAQTVPARGSLMERGGTGGLGTQRGEAGCGSAGRDSLQGKTGDDDTPQDGASGSGHPGDGSGEGGRSCPEGSGRGFDT
ncbi:tudor domain containing [Labeo rohita]|uniref:Tudor domain containing n=1 Tax=Labeo rohita TaxID=84645 RepID=A0A498MGV5_LABRO|nr:tudor domain containing [Labeo rohita]